MTIFKPALQRLTEASLSGPGCATLFEVLAEKMTDLGAETVEFRLGYTKDDEEPAVGEYVPEIILRLK